MPTLQHAIFADTVTGLADALKRDGYHLILGATEYLQSEEDAFAENFLSRRPDGFVLTGTLHSRRTLDRLQRGGLPIVETWELTDKPADMVVGFSNEQAAYTMTSTLVARGYRRIAFVSEPSRYNERARRRDEGYRRALAELGCEPLPIRHVGKPAVPRLEDGAAALREALADHPDAIFFTSDVYAAGAVLEARRLGLAVPDELGIAGFYDLDIARLITPTLTTVHIPAYDIGFRAGLAITGRLLGRPVEPVTTVPFVVVERGSTRP